MDKSQINSRVIDAINNTLELHPELTKAALGELFGVKPAKFSEILNLRMNAGVEIMSALCLNFDISADWLLTGRGDMVKAEQPAAGNTDPATFMQLVDTIRQQAQEIGQLKERIAQLEREGGKDVSTAHSETVARVG